MNDAASLPLNLTAVTLERFVPVIVTEVPTQPVSGAMLVMVGRPATRPVMPSFWIRTPLPEVPFAEKRRRVVEVKGPVIVIGPPVIYVEDVGVALVNVLLFQVEPLSAEYSISIGKLEPLPNVATLTLTVIVE